MAHYQIVCGSCGYRIHSDLLAKSLQVNKELIDAVLMSKSVGMKIHPTLEQALEQVPKEIKEVIFPRLDEPL